MVIATLLFRRGWWWPLGGHPGDNDRRCVALFGYRDQIGSAARMLRMGRSDTPFWDEARWWYVKRWNWKLEVLDYLVKLYTNLAVKSR